MSGAKICRATPPQLAEASQAIYERLNQRALLAAVKTEFAGKTLQRTGEPKGLPVPNISA